jgi:hypothetical protein
MRAFAIALLLKQAGRSKARALKEGHIGLKFRNQPTGRRAVR